MKRLLLGAAMLLSAALPASADTVLTLTPILGDTAGPQSISNPCIICATNSASQPAGFGYNNFVSTGATSTFNAFSTSNFETLADNVQGTGYTASQLAAFANIIDLSLNIIVDVNTTSARSEVLESFRVLNLTQGTQLAHFDGPANIGALANNGNGFGDFMLTGLSLAGVAPGDRIVFFARWSGAVDGGESFWLQPNVQAVPGPVVGAGLLPMLMGLAGLLGLQRYRKRKQQRELTPEVI